MNFSKKLMLAALLAVPTFASAQEPKANDDYIMPHLVDSKHLELPCFRSWREWSCPVEIPTYNVHVAGKELDILPTKHGVFLILTMIVVCGVLVPMARRHSRDTDAIGRPRGMPGGLEGVMLYFRQLFLEALGGHGGEKYVPFVLTLLFFVMIANVLGLLPWGASATGNLAVTGTLALITLVVVEIAGMRALGAGYIKTIVYWPHDMPFIGKAILTLLMTPVEFLGKLTKPFALTVRLFANMVAGHVILLAFMGMMFTSLLIGIPALGFAILMMFMELGVALLQAFIFAVLAAVFIGQIRAAHH